MRPLNEKILLKRLPKEKLTSGGIHLAGGFNQNEQLKAIVIEIGKGKLLKNGKRRKPQLNIGDTVLLAPLAGYEAGEDHIILVEDEILGVVA